MRIDGGSCGSKGGWGIPPWGFLLLSVWKFPWTCLFEDPNPPWRIPAQNPPPPPPRRIRRSAEGWMGGLMDRWRDWKGEGFAWTEGRVERWRDERTDEPCNVRFCMRPTGRWRSSIWVILAFRRRMLVSNLRTSRTKSAIWRGQYKSILYYCLYNRSIVSRGSNTNNSKHTYLCQNNDWECTTWGEPCHK